jgi:hypothetical protein
MGSHYVHKVFRKTELTCFSMFNSEVYINQTKYTKFTNIVNILRISVTHCEY